MRLALLLATLPIAACTDDLAPRSGADGGARADAAADAGGFLAQPDMGLDVDPLGRATFPAVVWSDVTDLNLGNTLLGPFALSALREQARGRVVHELLDLPDAGDLSGPDAVRVGFVLQAEDVSEGDTDFTEATHAFCYPAGEIDAGGEPAVQFDATVQDAVLEGRTEAFVLPLEFMGISFPLRLQNAVLEGELAQEVGGLRNGELSGGLLAADLDLEIFGVHALELLVCGGDVGGFALPPTPLDADIDGDGCVDAVVCDPQQQIAGCRRAEDGECDAAAIDDPACVGDLPDGYSVRVRFEAVAARVAGVCRAGGGDGGI